jgi:hypothetical protein
MKNLQIYDEFLKLDKQWTPIEPEITKIQIGSNPFHTIMRIQLLIQLATTRTMHFSLGLTFDCLTFDPINVTKHGLLYIALLRVRSKEKLYLFSPLLHNFFKWIILFKNKCFDQEQMHNTNLLLFI